MKTPESPLDLDSLLEPTVDAAPLEPLMSPPPASTSALPANPVQTASLAATNPWDTEEILDIPRAASANEAQADPLAVEDLFAATSVEAQAYADYSAPVLPVLDDAAPILEAPASTDTLWDATVDQPEVTGAKLVESEAVSTEPLAEEELEEEELYEAEERESSYAAGAASTSSPPQLERPSVFAQDSYTRANTYVMATPDSENKGRLAKIFIVAALAFGLLAVGYFALSGLVKGWLGARSSQQATVTPGATESAAANPETGASGVPGSTSSAGAKTEPDASNKTASPGVSASAAASAKPSVSPSVAASAAASPPPAASKPTATPAPAQAGTSGHAIGSGDGSLTVQLGAYKTAPEAQARVAKLKAAGLEGRVVKAEVPGKGTWYRVQSGRFTTEGDASKHANELRAKGVAKDFIITGYQNQ